MSLAFLLSSVVSDNKPIFLEKFSEKHILYDFLEEGDLVCRLGKGYFSNIFKEYASKDKTYSHIGIIVYHNNSPYVIHSEASEFTGVGGVKKEKLNDFLDDISVFSFFKLNINQEERIKVVEKSKYYLDNQVKFDLNFDSSDDSEMYCTEFIAKCINYGIEKDIIKPTINLNNNYYYGLDDIYNNDIVTKIK